MFPRSSVVDPLRRVLAGKPQILVALVAILAVALFLVSGWVVWFSYDLTAGLPNKDELRRVSVMAQATTIYDAGERPVFTIFKEQRIEVPLEKISRNLINAVISVEDQRFYDHTGVDAVRVAGAMVSNVREGRRAEGGSTITQQLARQSFLNRDKTYRRKLKEVIVATYLESLFTKDEILELYLNKVYFGDGLYGVEAAARGYLGKPASDLTVDEAALLAGLIQSPSSYTPTGNLDRALARRAVVLQAMVTAGVIDGPAAERAKRAPVKLTNGLEIKETYGLYFKEQVRRELVDRFGWKRVAEGGLRVYTTMDTELQQAAERLVERGLQDIERRSGFDHVTRAKLPPVKEGESPDYLQAALVAVDPTTGHVKAMVGGRDFNESRFNRAVQAKRQSGSAFKPFVFAAALEAGYSPASIISRLNDPVLTLEGEWVPEDEHSSATSMTLRTALRTSSNRAAVQLLNTVGIPSAVGYAEKLNVGTPPSVPSLALGASEVTLISLTSAYGAFANSGVVRQPVLIRLVEDSDGNVLYKDEQKGERAVSEATAFLMTSMLSDVINAGTAYRARQAGFSLPAAGKTGTTNDYNDAWFVGYTPQLVTGVWVGFDQPKTIVSNGYAGELAVPLWTSFMRVATRGHEPTGFSRPSNVVAVNVCRTSGKLPSAGCNSVPVVSRDGFVQARSAVYTEYFVKGTQPSTSCPLHPSPYYDVAVAASSSGETPPAVPATEAGLPAIGTSGSVPVAPPNLPAAPAARPSDPAQPPQQAEEPKKKRGFWSRVFGGGGDDDKKKKEEEEKKKQEERKKKGGG